MRKHRHLLLAVCGALLAAASVSANPSLLSKLSDGSAPALPDLDPAAVHPTVFLGQPIGERFNHHERLLAYLEELAGTSDRVATWHYGSTNEGRPLALVAVSSVANIARLEEIRSGLLRLAAPTALDPGERELLIAELPVLVWLAYGVHGNEASPSEAGLATAYVLAAARGDIGDLLEDVVVLIDPLVNPDGRERYVSGYEQRRGRAADAWPGAAEHWEPWPGGRQNHYLVDLNRDWTWASQQETRARIAEYQRWEPHVYVDFHEMSAESTYFFPPAAEPIHPEIGTRTRHWLEVFGRANAAAFDRQHWLYYAGEVFDLFYPGYGDSYPSLRGAIGMTYEVAGHGRAGEDLRLRDGGRLNLADRVARHLTTSLTTVQTAARHRQDLLIDFITRRTTLSTQPERLYLWRAEQQEARAAAELLLQHGVKVKQLVEETKMSAATLGDEALRAQSFPPGTFAVSTKQPLGALVRTLFERDASMPDEFLQSQRRRIEQNRDAMFFDITAWSLPLAFNLEVWRATGPSGNLRVAPANPRGAGEIAGVGGVGFLVPPQGLSGYRFAARLQQEEIRYRLALDGFTLGEQSFPSGTLFVPRHGNPDVLEPTLSALAAETGVNLVRTATAYSTDGLSLGSERMPTIRAPRVGLIRGRGTLPTSIGHLWFLFDQMIQLDHHHLDVQRIAKTKLSDFDALVFPDGDYDEVLDEADAEALGRWLKQGGVLVAVGGASEWLAERELITIETWPGEDAETESTHGADRPLDTPGAAVRTQLAESHALAVGMDRPPAVLVTGDRVLLATGDPRRDVLLVDAEAPVEAGFAWPEARERLAGSLLVATTRHGNGVIVTFCQDPAFRLFWRATTPLLLNAVLHAPSLLVDGSSRY